MDDGLKAGVRFFEREAESGHSFDHSLFDNHSRRFKLAVAVAVAVLTASLFSWEIYWMERDRLFIFVRTRAKNLIILKSY